MFSEYLCTIDMGLTQVPEWVEAIDKAYRDGFDSGRHWPDEWTHRPGGPFVFNAGYDRQQKYIDMQRFDELKHSAWMKGWEEGKKLLERVGEHYTIERFTGNRVLKP